MEALTVARDELGYGYFDFLTAVDQLDADPTGFDVVVHLWSLTDHAHLLHPHPRAGGRAGPGDAPPRVFSGAPGTSARRSRCSGWSSTGHPHLVPLLLPDGFEGHPLRKDFVLAARAAKAWPGAKEPGESDGDAHSSPSRRKTRPPGVPDPEVWGPR